MKITEKGVKKFTKEEKLAIIEEAGSNGVDFYSVFYSSPNSHIARHSFADIARQKGVSVYDISKALGHSNIEITQAYLASFDDGALENAMVKIFGDGLD